ncbi:MAG: hypothetical protein A3G75_04970 [Verrucomicrobia bacterium RIFCSPLOWO2_12_FULL_64_8]|nr:MAG: hypothetical protein A3G75_04970 [Verrucomicrobia bacterium RIFCSPLOWO2_12_FULL_64_8]
MPFIRRKSARFFFWAVAALFAVGFSAYAARAGLTGWAVRSALRAAGAVDVRLAVRDASPGRVVIEDLRLRIRQIPLEARQVSIVRERWWAPTLGRVDVAGARATVDVVDLAAATARLAGEDHAAEERARPPVEIPLEAVTIDGRLVVKAEGLEQVLQVSVAARLDPADRHWEGRAEVDGPGIAVRADAVYRPDAQELSFRVPTARLDLHPWQEFAQRVIPAAAQDWRLEGRVEATAEGRVSPARSTTSGTLKVQDGALTSATQPDGISGLNADLEFADLAGLATAPAQRLHIAEARFANLTGRDLDVRFQLKGADLVEVSSLTVNTLGGTIAVEPFQFVPSANEFAATLRAEQLSVEELLKLAPDVPAKASGRVDGCVPLSVNRDGVRFGAGWIGLSPGATAEVRFNAQGLLTSGMRPGRPDYAIMSKIEGGILQLRLAELRFDIHPPDAPAERSARLHLAGTPVDPAVKAPVTLDINVNGPVERLLDFGLSSRVSLGEPKP